MTHNSIDVYRRHGALRIALLLAFVAPSLAYSADFTEGADGAAVPPMPDPERFGPVRQKLHDWDVIIRAGVMYKPKYEGSDEMEILPIPFVSATFFDTLTIDPSGIELNAYETGPFQFDINVGYDGGRSEDDSDDLRGLGDVDGGISVGGKATLNYGPADVFVSIDKTIGGSDGLLGTVGVELEQPVTEKLILGAGVSATFADKNYMESYFGVTAAQAARSDYKTYKPGAGVKSVDLSLSATYFINENWLVHGEQKLGILVGDAADSPIVKDKLQPTSMLVLGYKF